MAPAAPQCEAEAWAGGADCGWAACSPNGLPQGHRSAHGTHLKLLVGRC